jgi:HAD superfamily hydrolase (TIGR01484 family)
MRPLDAFPQDELRRLRAVLSDIDDTLTTDGRLPAAAYAGMARLRAAGLLMIPITGRPAGWCDHIARMWPVDGVVGENGAFYFRYDDVGRTMTRRYQASPAERAENARRLAALRDEVLAKVPGAAVAADQAYRETDLAIDYCEDVARLSDDAVEEIVAIFRAAGAEAKVSSIHVNGWFGDYDKLAMTRRLLGEVFAIDLDRRGDEIAFLGDSPNDAPMFAAFRNSVGVANVRDFAGRLTQEPSYVTERSGGEGFAEFVDALLAARAEL